MTSQTWEVARTRTCHLVNLKVALETRVVHPADILPDQPGRVLAHRCSQGIFCNKEGRPSCVWAGTNPFIDPFIESF